MTARGAITLIASALVLVACGDGRSRIEEMAGADRGSEVPGVASAPGLDSASGKPLPVRTGADLLVASDFAPLRRLANRDGIVRVGLVANHTAVSGRRHLADLMAEASGITPAAIFAPEHGFRGDADAGAQIDDGRDPATGAPVFSLYGARRSPPDSVLAKLDVLVFDIQDVGARFYTYISTMGHSMVAAAKAGTPFVVLDRPNPLGGERIDGYVLEPEHRSFVGFYPIPVAHGLTVGELALMIRGEDWLEGVSTLELSVVPMDGWVRSMIWADTGLDWNPPSPNLPGFANALVYPGMCFMEGTSLNEGRGSLRPFLQFGAPWLEAESIADRLSSSGLRGLVIEAMAYTPRSIPGMSTSPRFQDTPVGGVALGVPSPHEVDPLWLGLEALTAVRDQWLEAGATDTERAAATESEDWLNERWMTRLAGTDRLVEALRRGDSAEQIRASWQAEVDAFRVRRAPYLQY